MSFLRFWPESGHLNDAVVSLSIILGMVFCAWLTWGKGGWWFLLVFPGGIILGFVAGLVFVMCMNLCFWKGSNGNLP